MRIVELNEESKKNLQENLLKRSPNQYTEYEDRVADILAQVRKRGDEAILEYTERFDGANLTPETLAVTEEEIQEAYQKIDQHLVEVIRKAIINIRVFHEKQKQKSWFESSDKGTILGQKVTALHRVGVYVPGGKAAYPSSVLMNVIPAKVAGVDQIVMVTPPGKDGKIYEGTLVAAKEAGVELHCPVTESLYPVERFRILLRPSVLRFHRAE